MSILGLSSIHKVREKANNNVELLSYPFCVILTWVAFSEWSFQNNDIMLVLLLVLGLGKMDLNWNPKIIYRNGLMNTSLILPFNPSKILGVLMLICVIGLISALLCRSNEEDVSWWVWTTFFPQFVWLISCISFHNRLDL